VLATCEEFGIGFIPFTPVGAGFLTGKITVQGARLPAPSRSRFRRIGTRYPFGKKLFSVDRF